MACCHEHECCRQRSRHVGSVSLLLLLVVLLVHVPVGVLVTVLMVPLIVFTVVMDMELLFCFSLMWKCAER